MYKSGYGVRRSDSSLPIPRSPFIFGIGSNPKVRKNAKKQGFGYPGIDPIFFHSRVYIALDQRFLISKAKEQRLLVNSQVLQCTLTHNSISNSQGSWVFQIINDQKYSVFHGENLEENAKTRLFLGFFIEKAKNPLGKTKPFRSQIGEEKRKFIGPPESFNFLLITRQPETESI